MQWADNLGAESDTVTDLIKEDNEEIKLELMAQIQKVNRKAVSNAQKVSISLIAILFKLWIYSILFAPLKLL